MTPQACERELDRLYRRHGGEVRRYVRLVLRERDDVDDLVQQTFLKALRALRTGIEVERPRQWLVAIAHNECRQHFRAAARRVQLVRLDEATEPAPAADGPTAAELREALTQLAPNQRAALVQRELEGRSYGEIAKALELTESAVETLLFRARRALREQLEPDAGCEDAKALLAADVLTEAQRRRLRAHVRSCAGCRTLERRRRGRLAAARRLASLFPVPSWFGSLAGGSGGKAAAVAVAAAVAAGGGAVGVGVGHTGKQQPRPAPQLVHRDAVVRPAARPPAPRPVRRVPARKPTPNPAPAKPVRPVAEPAHAAAPAPRPASPQPPPRPAPEPPPLPPPPSKQQPAAKPAPAPAPKPQPAPKAPVAEQPPAPRAKPVPILGALQELPAPTPLPQVAEALPQVTATPPQATVADDAVTVTAPSVTVSTPAATVTAPQLPPVQVPLPEPQLPHL